MLFVEAIALSLIVALVRGGSLRRLGELDFRNTWMIFAPAVMMALLYTKYIPGLEFVGRLALVVHSAAYAVVLAVIIVNRHLPGMAIVGIGAALNFAVMAANGGKMPVSYDAVKRVHMEREFSANMARHSLLDKDTRLGLLADIIPRPWPPFPERDVASFGDIFLSVGLFILVQHGACSRKRRLGDAPVNAESSA
jgi:hypothetical protein